MKSAPVRPTARLNVTSRFVLSLPVAQVHPRSGCSQVSIQAGGYKRQNTEGILSRLQIFEGVSVQLIDAIVSSFNQQVQSLFYKQLQSGRIFAVFHFSIYHNKAKVYRNIL